MPIRSGIFHSKKSQERLISLPTASIQNCITTSRKYCKRTENFTCRAESIIVSPSSVFYLQSHECRFGNKDIRQLGSRVAARPLDTETPGRDAVTSLVANIRDRDLHIDKVVHFTANYGDCKMYRVLGWKCTSPICITYPADHGTRTAFRHGMQGWIVEGVQDLDRIAAAA